MTARNDVTGDLIKTSASKKYQDNFDNVTFARGLKNEMVVHLCSKMNVKISTIKSSQCKYCGETYD